MEYINPTLLQKYETIINEINIEHEKFKQLEEELQHENNNLVVYNLVKSGTLEKLSHIDVKIFNTVTELLNLYAEDLDKTILQHKKYCKYYLVEIYFTKLLLDKLSKPDWLVSVSVHCDTFHLSKSVKLPRKSQTIMEIFPIMESISDCTVDAYLINTKNQSMVFKLDSVNIDISYYFYKYRRSYNKLYDSLYLTKLYNKSLDINCLKDLPPLMYQLTLPLEKQKFIETVLNNSYHNLDVEMFGDLHNENKKDITIQIGANFNKIEVVFNHDNMKIKGNYKDLQKLKKYFLNMLHRNGYTSKKVSGLLEVNRYFS